MPAYPTFRGPFLIRNGLATSRLVLRDGVVAAQLWDSATRSWVPADSNVLVESFDWRTRRLTAAEAAALGIPADDCAPWPRT